MRGVLGGFAGALFGVGLAIAGMTQPSKVIGFLDVLGVWDPSLAFVMAAAIGVHLVTFRLVTRRRSPLLADAFQIPTRRDLTGRLVLGAGLFGVGWGLGGYCPGPGLVGLGSGSVEALTFVATMLAGMHGFEWLSRRPRRGRPPGWPPSPTAAASPASREAT